MKVLLDTANLAEIQWGAAAGLIDGVSTNPSLIAHAFTGRDPTTHVEEICRLVRGPVTVQVISSDADSIHREARDLARVADNVIVEIPVTEEGLAATRRLTPDGVRVNATLVFTAAQAMLAARAGAAYVSPFVGRLDEAGADGIGVLGDIRAIFDRYGFECEIIASSIRSPRRFLDAARAGAELAAVPPSVLRALLVHPLTEQGLARFLEDWRARLATPKEEA